MTHNPGTVICHIFQGILCRLQAPQHILSGRIMSGPRLPLVTEVRREKRAKNWYCREPVQAAFLVWGAPFLPQAVHEPSRV
jgi:hypothetical protein